MQTLSSASRTCMASASAVECTATVDMPSSLHARRTRSAISPRLAIRILSNISSLGHRELRMAAAEKFSHGSFAPLLDDHQRFAEFDRLSVLDENLRHRARARRWNLVH